MAGRNSRDPEGDPVMYVFIDDSGGSSRGDDRRKRRRYNLRSGKSDESAEHPPTKNPEEEKYGIEEWTSIPS